MIDFDQSGLEGASNLLKLEPTHETVLTGNFRSCGLADKKEFVLI